MISSAPGQSASGGCWTARRAAGRQLTVALIAAGAVFSLLLPGCGGHTIYTLQPGATLRVGYSFPFDSADVAGRIALERYGRAEHIKPMLEELPGAPAVVGSLLRGDVGMASLNLPDAIKAIAQGARLQVLLGSKMVPEYVFISTPGIARASQLAGKRIGIQGHGSDTEAFTKLLLASAHLAVGDVHEITVPNSTARVAALLHGQVDATALRYHEYLRLIRRQPRIHLLSEMRYFEPHRMTQVWVVSDAFERHNQRALQTMVRDMLATYDFIYTPQGRSAWIANGTPNVFRGDPPSIPVQVYSFYHRIGMWPRSDRPITAASYAQQLKEMLGTGQVIRSVPYRAVWNPSFWDAAAAKG